jgi:hypothetical protein
MRLSIRVLNVFLRGGDMKILALGRDKPGVGSDEFQPYLKLEARRVWELYKEGILREFYFWRDSPDAVLILECKDAEQARDYLETLPLVEEGLISFEIIPLRPYPGFERLFA